MSGYPTAQPAWQQEELNKLSAAGLLSGINPLILSGIAQGESGYENAGAGVNSSGYGGYFGLGQNSTYSYGGKSFTDTPSELKTNSVASFDEQAQAAAAEVARELAAYHGDLYGALVTSNAFYSGDYNAAESFLGGAGPYAPAAGSGELVVHGGGAAAPTGGSGGATDTTGAGGGTTNATTTAFGGSLNPANWPGEVVNALKPWVARIVLVIVALILLKVGFDKLLDTDSTPGQMIVEPVQASGNKGVAAPGTGKPHPVAHKAEEGAETAAVAA